MIFFCLVGVTVSMLEPKSGFFRYFTSVKIKMFSCVKIKSISPSLQLKFRATNLRPWFRRCCSTSASISCPLLREEAFCLVIIFKRCRAGASLVVDGLNDLGFAFDNFCPQ